MIKISQLGLDSFEIQVEGGDCTYCVGLPNARILSAGSFSCNFFQGNFESSESITARVTSTVSSQHAVERITVSAQRPDEFTTYDMTKSDEGYWYAIIAKSSRMGGCEMCVSCMRQKVYPSYRLTINPCPSLPQRRGPSALLENLESLCERQMLTDVQFDVEGETLKAHTQILAANSPVLAAMFSHKEKFQENVTGVVQIQDAGADVFRQFLRYLYTGVAPRLEEEAVAQELLVLADKYEVDSLKEECASSLVHHLTVDNLVVTLRLAYLHSAKDLCEQCLFFTSKNWSDVFSRRDWLQLGKEFPDLIFQATHFFARQLALK